MKVYLIRHGQTKGNAENIHQGWTDEFTLTEEGIKQAHAIKKVVTKKKYDRIICSDVLRTRQTCSIIFGDDARVEYDPRLREVDNNVLSGMRRDEVYAKYGEIYLDRRHHLDYSFCGGESDESVVARTGEFLRDLEADTTSKRIALVTHGGTIHGFLANVLHMPLYCPYIKIDNCSVTELAYNGEGWTLVHVNNKEEL